MKFITYSSGTVFLAVLVGCGSSGPQQMKVWGDVAYDGKPVENGSITFLPPAGSTTGTATGTEIIDGHYEIPAKQGPVAGLTYKVEIKGQRKVGTIPNPFNPSGPPSDKFESYIPAVYNQKSKLTVVISETASANKHDFRLDPK